MSAENMPKSVEDIPQFIEAGKAANREQIRPRLEALVPFQSYPLRNGGRFEFRYVADSDYGFLFGLVKGRDVYLHLNDLEE